MLPTIVSTLHRIDHNLGVYGETTMTDQIGSSQSSLLHRFFIVAGGRVCCHGACAGRGWTVWRGCVFGQPADA